MPIGKIDNTGPSACTGTHCILLFARYCIFGLVLHLYCCGSLFLLFYVICTPVHTEGTDNTASMVLAKEDRVDGVKPMKTRGDIMVLT